MVQYPDGKTQCIWSVDGDTQLFLFGVNYREMVLLILTALNEMLLKMNKLLRFHRVGPDGRRCLWLV